MKILFWKEDNYKKDNGRESQRDLMEASVMFDNGSEGKHFATRAEMKRLNYIQEHVGLPMTESDFQNYTDLVLAVAEVDRIFEEE